MFQNLTNDKRHSVCIVGLGNVGALYDAGLHDNQGRCHAGAILLSDGMRLAGGVDVNEGRRRSFSEAWKEPAYSSLEQAFGCGVPDVVCVAVHPEQQAAVCDLAIESGVRAIVCEKPFVGEETAARRIIDICRQRKVVLAVNHWMRWSASWEAAKRLIRDGEVGEMQRVRYLYSRGVMNSGTHAIDILRYVFGEVASVTAIQSYTLDTGDENIDGDIRFVDGTCVELRALDYRHHFTTECDIIGTKGRLLLESATRYWKVHRDGTGRGRLQEVPFPAHVSGDRPFVRMLDEVAGVLDGKGAVRCSGEDGMMAVVVACALQASALQGGTEIII